MKKQRPPAKISSFVTPTEQDLSTFKRLSPDEQRALLRVEMDKGFADALSKRRADKATAKAPAKSNDRK